MFNRFTDYQRPLEFELVSVVYKNQGKELHRGNEVSKSPTTNSL